MYTPAAKPLSLPLSADSFGSVGSLSQLNIKLLEGRAYIMSLYLLQDPVHLMFQEQWLTNRPRSCLSPGFSFIQLLFILPKKTFILSCPWQNWFRWGWEKRFTYSGERELGWRVKVLSQWFQLSKIQLETKKIYLVFEAAQISNEIHAQFRRDLSTLSPPLSTPLSQVLPESCFLPLLDMILTRGK